MNLDLRFVLDDERTPFGYASQLVASLVTKVVPLVQIAGRKSYPRGSGPRLGQLEAATHVLFTSVSIGQKKRPGAVALLAHRIALSALEDEPDTKPEVTRINQATLRIGRRDLAEAVQIPY
jgi:hypothetical protein